MRWGLIVGDDNFLAHFGPAPEILSEGSMSAATGHEWDVSRKELRGFGRVVEMLPKGAKAVEVKKNRVSCRESHD
jgi:U3 small nucleolar RNA-associated protein 25